MIRTIIDPAIEPVKMWKRALTICILQIFMAVSIDQASAAPSYLPATCDQSQADTCIDSTPCKTFGGSLLCLSTIMLPLADGTPAPPPPVGATVVPETCWNYSAQFSCLDSVKPDSCTSLIAKGCTQIGSSCETDATGTLMTMHNGTCTTYGQIYQCQTSPPSTSTIQDCSGASVCSSGNCWSTTSTPDTDFASAVTQMETVRQASIYQGADMKIFDGDPESCTTGYGGLRKCCDGKGGGTSNGSTLKSSAQQLAFSAAWYYAKPLAVQGATYVQDFMFAPDAYQNFAQVGSEAMFGGASEFSGLIDQTGSLQAAGEVFSGAADMGATVGSGGGVASSGFGAYGITYGASAVQGYEAGSVVSGAGTLGGPLVSLGDGFAFDPVSLGIMIAIMIISAMISCTAEEATLQMHKGSNLCTYVGSYCSTKFLGACLVTTQGYCCYNSILARLINEQGRPQIGKGYGSPQSPDCSGFTIAQVQQLNFSTMDLSEFTNTIVPNLPNMPNIPGIQQSVGANQSKVTTNNTSPSMGN